MLLIFFLWTLSGQFDKLVIVESVLLMKKRKKKKKIFITIIAILLLCLVGFFAYFYLFKNDEIINKVKKVKEPVKKLNIISMIIQELFILLKELLVLTCLLQLLVMLKRKRL